MTRICVVVLANTMVDLKNEIEKAEELKPDFIEVRMDYLNEEIKFSEIRNISNSPLIATIRPKSEEGYFEGSEDKRLKLLFKAVENGFDYIDIEWKTKECVKIVEKMKKRRAETIVSTHNFLSTPSLHEMSQILGEMQNTGADICKLITKATSIDDNLTILQFVKKESKEKRLISFCMGKLGVLSRILSPFFGSFFTYASLEKGKESAEGQLTIEETREIYALLRPQ